MPRHVLPRTSGAHRVAAIALFRALLIQCRALPSLEEQHRDALQNVVRNRFKQARHEQSARRLKLNFEAGYEAIDHLDAAVAGDEERRRYIVTLLERAPEQAKQPPPVILPKKLERELKKIRAKDAGETESVQKPSLFDRPLPLEKLSGRRHVPVLYNAQKIPVLRLKKPQPENLSGYLAHRLRLRQKRHDTRHKLDDELEIARSEDRWDGLVAGATGREGYTFEPAWSAGVGMARREVNEKLDEERRKNREMAVKMQGVIDRERELYEKEKVERSEAKKQRWLDKLKDWKMEKRRDASAVRDGVQHSPTHEPIERSVP